MFGLVELLGRKAPVLPSVGAVAVVRAALLFESGRELHGAGAGPRVGDGRDLGPPLVLEFSRRAS